MPRHPRVHAQGLLYHVMARGNDGRKVFHKDSDYEAFLNGLAAARDRFICQAVLEDGYLASELASFLGCYPSNVSRALQKGLAS